MTSSTPDLPPACHGLGDTGVKAMRVVAAIAAAVLLGVLAGCSPNTYWVERNAPDLALTEELRQDPWLVASQTRAPFVPLDVPSQEHWVEGSASGYGDRVKAPVTQVLPAELSAAAAAGWWPYYATCAGLWEPERPREGDRIEVLLARELSGEVLAQAELVVEVIDAANAEPRTGIARGAQVPSQQHTQVPAPERVDVGDLACLTGSGPSSVGSAVDLLEDLR